MIWYTLLTWMFLVQTVKPDPMASASLFGTPIATNKTIVEDMIKEHVSPQRNSTANACDDFYDHVCGKFVVSDEAASEYGAEEEIKMYERLRIAAENNATINRSSAWFKKFGKAFNVCSKMTEDIRDQQIQVFIISIGGWRLLGSQSERHIGLESLAGLILKKTGIETLVTSKFDKAPQGNRIQLILELRSEISEARSAQAKTLRTYLHAYSPQLRENSQKLDQMINEFLIIQDELSDLRKSYRESNMEQQDGQSKGFNISVYISEAYSDHKYHEQIGQQKSLSRALSTLIQKFGEKRLKNWIRMRAFLDGIRGLTERGACLDVVMSGMDVATTRLIVEEYLPSRVKLHLSTMTSYIKHAYRQYISKMPGIDTRSKRYLMSKLNAMESNLGWPSWIHDDATLNNWYKNLDFSEDPGYFELLVRLHDFSTIKFYEVIEWQYRDTLFPLPYQPFSSKNAFYHHFMNKFSIQPGIVKVPYYYLHSPAVVNFGAMGTTIGHEISHTFGKDHMLRDFDGAQEEESDCNNESGASVSGECPTGQDRPKSYDHYGKRLPAKTRKILQKKQKCLINHYSQYCLGRNTTCIDGQQTLAENEADILGLKVAFYGYKLWTELEGKRLDSVIPNSEISDEQLFFVSYAKQWCTKVDQETADLLLRRDSHSLAPFRVLGPLSQMKEFKDAFQCQYPNGHNTDSCEYWW